MARRSGRILGIAFTASTLLGLGVSGCTRETRSPEGLAPMAPLSQTSSASPAPSLDPTSLARVRGLIAQREYWVHAGQDGELVAPNRAHGLRSRFAARGLRVHDLTAPGSPELLTLSWIGVGRGRAPLRAPGAGEVASERGRVEIRRPEGLVEWYLNSPAGLEQGFALAERPSGEGPLVLELAVASASARRLGDAVELRTGAGRTLAYGGLVAHEADGTELVARLEVPDPARIRIVVDDAGATYPLAIDPLLTETADAVLQASASSASVASAGDVNGDGYADVIVGDLSAGSTGAAYVFLGGPTGIASGGPADADTVLTSSQFASAFGGQVASAGDVNGDGYADVIVGASSYDAGQGFGEGAAFVFLGGPAGIASGDVSTASARLESDQAISGGISPALGVSVASAGDVNGDGYDDVIVGASGYDAGQGLGEGAAFVFLGSASGIASGNPSTADSVLEANQVGAFLGGSVASAGDVDGDGYADVIVGAGRYDNGTTDEGAAFVFLGGPSGIPDGNPATAATTLESNQPAGGGGNAPSFGESVASAGDVNGDGYADVIVGAPSYDKGQLDEGAAFVFLGGAAGVASGNPATAHAVFESDQLGPLGGGAGSGVASAGDVNGDGYADVIVGVRFYTDGQMLEGAAAVFLGSASGLASGTPQTAYARLEVDQVEANLGTRVAGLGDVNGDGYDDVSAGAYAYDDGVEPDVGAAFLYLGGGLGIASQLQGESFSGEGVASAGDVNGDGYDDVIVGIPSKEWAEIWYGGADGIPGDFPPDVNAIVTDQPGSLFAHTVASAGDVNGDGFADVIVGAPGYDDGETDEGAAFIFHGSPTGIQVFDASGAAAKLETNQAGAGLVSSFFPELSAAGAGDVNGDGYADVIVGSGVYDHGTASEGAAFVFLGSATGIASGGPATAAAVLDSDQGGSSFGFSVASAGDVNGDGYADAIVGAWSYGPTSLGAAFVFHGSPTGIASGNPTTADAALESTDASFIGVTVASAGDVNGDGYADVILGSSTSAGIFLGSDTGIASGDFSTAAALLSPGPPPLDTWFRASPAGDVNGDGYGDVIVGNPRYSNSEAGEGAAFVFLGSAAGIASGDETAAASVLEPNVEFGALSEPGLGPVGDVNGDGFADVGFSFFPLSVPPSFSLIVLGNGGQPGRSVRARQQRGDGSFAPVQPWGASNAEGRFGIEITAQHPEGVGRVRPEYEVCPPGVPFGDAGCERLLYPSWVGVGGSSPEASLAQNLVDLAPNALYRWRVRIQRAPATGALPANPAHGPWRRPGAQAREADVRALPEPAQVVQLALALGALALRARRRRARQCRGQGRA